MHKIAVIMPKLVLIECKDTYYLFMNQSSHSVIHISNLLAIPRRLTFKLSFKRIRQKIQKGKKAQMFLV